VANEDDDESLQGLLIAAMSVLTTSILENPIDDEIQKPGEASDVDVDNLLSALQDSGPLALASDTLQDHDLLGSLRGDSFLLDKELMSYFRDASAVCMKSG